MPLSRDSDGCAAMTLNVLLSQEDQISTATVMTNNGEENSTVGSALEA